MEILHLLSLLTAMVGCLPDETITTPVDLAKELDVESIPAESLVPHSRKKRFIPRPNGKHGLRWDEIEMIVLMHNNYRGIVNPTSSNMRFLVSQSSVHLWWRHQMEAFSALLTLCAGNSPVTGEFPHKGQWRGALMFSLISVWINGWVHNREAGDLRCHRAHHDVTVMWNWELLWCQFCRRWRQWRQSWHQDDVGFSSVSSMGREGLSTFIIILNIIKR